MNRPKLSLRHRPPPPAVPAASHGEFDLDDLFAGIYSLVATCEAHGINPFDYLVDGLGRVQDHPARAIDELLPGAWAAAG